MAHAQTGTVVTLTRRNTCNDGSFVSVVMPRGKAKKSVSSSARKSPAKNIPAGAAVTAQSSSIPSSRPKRTATTTTQPPPQRSVGFQRPVQGQKIFKGVPQRIRIGDQLKGVAVYKLRQRLPKSLRKVRVFLLPRTSPGLWLKFFVKRVYRKLKRPGTTSLWTKAFNHRLALHQVSTV